MSLQRSLTVFNLHGIYLGTVLYTDHLLSSFNVQKNARKQLRLHLELCSALNFYQSTQIRECSLTPWS